MSIEPIDPIEPVELLRAEQQAWDFVDDPASFVDAPEAAPISDGPAVPIVEIRTSTRRRRTVTAYREGDRTIVLVPARMSKRDREQYAAELVERLQRRETRARRSDTDLVTRSRQLSRRWLGGRATPTSVRWVTNQNTRWGSCTPVDGTIRLSDRMQGMPPYVIDAVLLHELAHLVHADHSPEFWALLEPFPDHERAKSYLDGVVFGQTHPPRAN